MVARFSAVPARAYTDPRVTDRHLRLLGLLGLFTDSNGWTYVGQKRLASMMQDPGRKRDHVSPSRISQMMKDLREWGYIETRERWGAKGERLSNWTRVLFDVGEPEEADIPDCEPPSNPTGSGGGNGQSHYPHTPPPAPNEYPWPVAPTPTPIPAAAAEGTSQTQSRPAPAAPVPQPQAHARTPTAVEETQTANTPLISNGANPPPISPTTKRNNPLFNTPDLNLTGSAGGEAPPLGEFAQDPPPLEALGDFGVAFGGIPDDIDVTTPAGQYRARLAAAMMQGAKRAARDPLLKVLGWFPEDVRGLARAFSEAFTPPHHRRQAMTWVSPLREMLREGVTAADIHAAVRALIEGGIAIKSPHTIKNKAITLAVARRKGIKPSSVAKGCNYRGRGEYFQSSGRSTRYPRDANDVAAELGLD